MKFNSVANLLVPQDISLRTIVVGISLMNEKYRLAHFLWEC